MGDKLIEYCCWRMAGSKCKEIIQQLQIFSAIEGKEIIYCQVKTESGLFMQYALTSRIY